MLLNLHRDNLIAFPVQATTTLNLSHDLVPLAIATQNLVPNTASLDAGPLFQAAVQFISTGAGGAAVNQAAQPDAGDFQPDWLDCRACQRP
jgi:hypothetical protein